MWKKLLNSFNGRMLVICTILYAGTSLTVGHLYGTSAATPIILFYLIFMSVWPWFSHKKYSILILKCFYRNRVAIELIDWKKEHYYTLAIKQENNTMIAPVYFANNTGEVVCLEDGTVDKSSYSSYIKYWLPLNKSDRTQHLLTYGLHT